MTYASLREIFVIHLNIRIKQNILLLLHIFTLLHTSDLLEVCKNKVLPFYSSFKLKIDKVY